MIVDDRMHQRDAGATPYRRITLVAGMAAYLDGAALVTTGFVVGTLYPEQLGLSPNEIGLVIGLQTVAVAVGSLIGGRLGDRYGRRRGLIWALLAFVIGLGMCAQAQDSTMLLAGVIIGGLAIGADLPVSLAMIQEAAPPGRKARMVTAASLMWLGGVVAALVMGVLVAPQGAWGGRLAFGYLAVVAFLVLLFRLTLPESAEWQEARERATDAAQQAALARAQVGPSLFWQPAILKVAVATGAYYTLWSIGGNTLGQYGAFMWVHLTGSDTQTYLLLATLFLPVTVTCVAVFMRYADSRSRHRWFVVCSVISVGAWLLPVVAGFSLPFFVTYGVLLGIASAATGDTIFRIWSQELVPTLQRSTVQGITTAVARITSGAFAIVTPALILGAPRLLFGLVALLGAVAALIGAVWISPAARAAVTDTQATSDSELVIP
ncbi:MAG: MFS transporter [Phycicoccus sp.]|nr:MFS transporter [Phycicoccus sp.]